MAASSEKVTFPGHTGEMLAARLDLPAGPPRAYALFAHCFTCSKDLFAAARIATALAENGFAVLRFDFTGLGASDGEFANTNFSSNVQDLLEAANLVDEPNSLSAEEIDVVNSLSRGEVKAIISAAQKLGLQAGSFDNAIKAQTY